MRNVISLNQDWKFIQQDAGLPETLPAKTANCLAIELE